MSGTNQAESRTSSHLHPRVKECRYRVTFDSSDENAFHLHHKYDGTLRIFKQFPKSLDYLDTLRDQKDTKGVSLVNTVADNATMHSEGDYSKAELARRIQKQDHRSAK